VPAGPRDTGDKRQARCRGISVFGDVDDGAPMASLIMSYVRDTEDEYDDECAVHPASPPPDESLRRAG
jgi:hypothetical protein